MPVVPQKHDTTSRQSDGEILAAVRVRAQPKSSAAYAGTNAGLAQIKAHAWRNPDATLETEAHQYNRIPKSITQSLDLICIGSGSIGTGNGMRGNGLLGFSTQ